MSQIITVPFGYLLDWLYQFTANYGVAPSASRWF